MRTIKFTLLVLLSLATIIPCYSQIAYYDAKALKEYVKNVSGKPRIQSKGSDLNGYIKILKKYIPESDRDNIKIGSDLQDYFETNGNNFLEPFFLKGTLSTSGIPSVQTQESIGLKNISGLNVTKFADGLAKFLVERTKEELSITFFNKFKDELDSLEELRLLFPKTHDLLSQIDQEIYQFSAYTNMLKETFQQDLKTIIPNLRRVINTDRIQAYLNLNPTVDFILNEALIIAEEFQNGTHPGDIITRLKNEANDDALGSFYKPSLQTLDLISQSIRSNEDGHYWVSSADINALINDKVTFDIFLGLVYQKAEGIDFNGTDLRSVLAQIKRQATQLDAVKNYLNQIGLEANRVDQSLKAVIDANSLEAKRYESHFQFFTAGIDLIETALMFEGIDAIQQLLPLNFETDLLKFLDVARNAGDLYMNISQKKYFSAVLDLNLILDDGLLNDAIAYREILVGIEDIKKNVDEIENSLKSGSPSEKVKAEAKVVLRRVLEVIDLFQDLNSNIDVSKLKAKYTIANNYIRSDWVVISDELNSLILDKDVKDLIELLEPISNKLSGFTSKLMKYGNLAAGFAEAENSDEVKELIASIALPSGSSRIKRVSKFNVSLNAYVGPYYGQETINGAEMNSTAPVTGLMSPVGVAASWGVKDWSISLFASFIDIGALTAYRFDDDNPEGVPEVKFENIVAPGGFAIFGIKGTPFSFGGGYQFGPSLRKITVTIPPNDPMGSPTLGTETSSSRGWKVFFAVDIPLLNLFTSAK